MDILYGIQFYVFRSISSKQSVHLTFKLQNGKLKGYKEPQYQSVVGNG